jgi:Tat protein translocase TatB subunit
MFGTLGGPELFLIFVVALIVFGPRKLPEIGKSLGKMMAEFRKASNDFRSTIESEVEAEKIREAMRIEAPPATAPAAASPYAPAAETTASPYAPGADTSQSSTNAETVQASSPEAGGYPDSAAPDSASSSSSGELATSANDGSAGEEASASREPIPSANHVGVGADGEAAAGTETAPESTRRQDDPTPIEPK